MMIELLVFYATGFAVVIAALAMILMKNPVHSALCLVLAFVASAALWLLLEAEFLALILIFVYVGAVMTLFLFVVMMLNLRPERFKKHFVPYFIVAILLVALMLALMLMVIAPEQFNMLVPAHQTADYSNIQALGAVLYTEYVYPLELAAVLLLVAMVSAVSLSHTRKKISKTQNIDRQVKTQPSQRVRLVSMPAEVKHKQDKSE
jgi:NADH-quinone oxidoreductase subunit J